MSDTSEKIVRLLPKKDGVHWVTLVLSIVSSSLIAIAIVSYQAGRYAEKFDQYTAQGDRLGKQVGTLADSTSILASGVSSLTAQVGSLRDAISAERQDRLSEQQRLFSK